MNANPVAVSSWSLHHTLGTTYRNGPHGDGSGPHPTYGAGRLSLLELPAALASKGYFRVEICHFHVASRAPTDLARLRQAFAAAGVAIQTLLIDDGDLTDPATRDGDLQWILDWIDAAAAMGAENARVVAGKRKPDAETLALAVDGLGLAVRRGKDVGVRIVTENWFDLLSTPDVVDHVLDAVGPDLGFLADTGNWAGPTKYRDLEQIFARAELCHAKTAFGPGLSIDAADYRQSIEAAKRANYRGPYTLIFDSPGDEWAGLAAERKFIAGQ